MTETGASGHAVKAVHHTGGAGSPSFSGLSVLCINNIGGFKTGTGAAAVSYTHLTLPTKA